MIQRVQRNILAPAPAEMESPERVKSVDIVPQELRKPWNDFWITPVAKDTIFRIASMTTPIAGVALMMLFEEGKWRLDDPVARYITRFTGAAPSGRGSGSIPPTT